MGANADHHQPLVFLHAVNVILRVGHVCFGDAARFGNLAFRAAANKHRPVFIRRRTEGEIAEARGVAETDMPDPQNDIDRVQKDEWLVMVGICTHLGCVPLGQAGDFNGWFCPCHGSHYDTSGRIRKGPAPKNLEIPSYEFVGDSRIKIG